MDRLGLILMVSFIVIYVVSIIICLIVCVHSGMYGDDDSDYDYDGNDRV